MQYYSVALKTIAMFGDRDTQIKTKLITMNHFPANTAIEVKENNYLCLRHLITIMKHVIILRATYTFNLKHTSQKSFMDTIYWAFLTTKWQVLIKCWVIVCVLACNTQPHTNAIIFVEWVAISNKRMSHLTDANTKELVNASTPL